MEKLLSFMSAWDRKNAVEKYRDILDDADDPDAVIEALGTPTALAVRLAKNYRPTLPPKTDTAETPPESPLSLGQYRIEDVFPAKPQTQTEPAQEEMEPAAGSEELAAAKPEAAPDSVPDQTMDTLPNPADNGAEPKRTASETPEGESDSGAGEPPQPKTGRKVLAGIFSILIGVPVGIVLICIGIPFLAVGSAMVAVTITLLPMLVLEFHLFSDTLLAVGVGLVALAVGLFLAWLGLWISIELSALWVGKGVRKVRKKILSSGEAMDK